MLIGFGCLLVFLAMAGLMYSRRLSALLALPLMAVLIALIGGIPGQVVLNKVIGQGALKLHVAYTTTMFGAMLAELMNKQGIAKALVRWVAEFAGDNPFVLGVLLTGVSALLFSTLGGLGAVIMVGTIVLPVMLSVGIPGATAGGLLLFGISIGGMFNLATWQVYTDILGVTHQQIASFVLPLSCVMAGLVLFFLVFELRRLSNLRYALAGVIFLFGVFWAFCKAGAGTAQAGAQTASPGLMPEVLLVCALLAVFALARHINKASSLPGLAMLTPFVPLCLVLLSHWDIIPAFMVGLAFGTLTTWQRNSINTLTRSILDGAANVIPAVVLMIGIGILYSAVTDDKLKEAMSPLLVHVVPTHALAYILVFTLAAPLSLYRGPLNIFGMGSGLAALMQKATALSSQAIFGMMMSVGQVQGVCDPTNTHNVWIATYLGTDTRALLMRTLPFVWVSVAFGLGLAAVSGYVPW